MVAAKLRDRQTRWRSTIRGILGAILIAAWGVFSVYGRQSCGSSALDPNAGIPESNQVHLEYTYLKDYENKKFDAWKKPAVESSIKDALLDAGVAEFKYVPTGPVSWPNAQLDLSELGGFYTFHKGKSVDNFPYFLISVAYFTGGPSAGAQGYTPVLLTPGNDARTYQNCSILMFENIKSSASVLGSQGMWGAVAVHEIGRQRAALVDVETNPGLHRCCPSTEGTEGYSCVMHLFVAEMPDAQKEAIATRRKFCGDVKDYGGDTPKESCVRYMCERNHQK